MTFYAFEAALPAVVAATPRNPTMACICHPLALSGFSVLPVWRASWEQPLRETVQLIFHLARCSVDVRVGCRSSASGCLSAICQVGSLISTVPPPMTSMRSPLSESSAIPTRGVSGGGVGADRAFVTVPDQPYPVYRQRFDAAIGEDYLGGPAQRQSQLLHNVRREGQMVGEPGINKRFQGSGFTAMVAENGRRA